MQGPHLRPSVVRAREELLRGREKLRAQHDSGSPGVQLCALQTDLLDRVVLQLFRTSATGFDAFEQTVALVAHGGYGRRDVAPYSDVDLMLLVEPRRRAAVVASVQQFTQSITDAGLQLGFSVRGPREACSMAMKDATIFTSLSESRLLAGNPDLYESYSTRFKRQTRRHSTALIEAIDKARRAERRQFGETVYLLEPNIKRSSGGLRDLQFIRWIGYARHGEADPEHLERRGVLEKPDRRKLKAAREFLLRLRNELHFHAEKAQDVIGKTEQLRLAEHFQYDGTEHTLPVEAFMRDYIEHTREVRYIASHFLATSKRRLNLPSIVDPVFCHQVSGDFQVGPLHIRATKRGLEKVTSDLADTLRLMELSNWYNVRIAHHTWQAVRKAMKDRAELVVTRDTAERFLSMLSQPARLGNLLRQLHEMRVLEKLVPAMAHARCLMQFNDYHKFTVDEHSIRAVEAATEFLDDEGLLGETYRGLRDKRLLHLALLIHDLGKGFPEDHSEVGSRIAVEVASRLGLHDQEAETLRFLVHRHLSMSHLAQRRDINDDQVVIQFAVEVGSVEILQMLYLLTCADLAAVGPGVLNRWKHELITQLYVRARDYLTGGDFESSDSTAAECRSTLQDRLAATEVQPAWTSERIEALPRGYVLSGETSEIVTELQTLAKLSGDQVASWSKYLPELNAVEFTVGAHETITAGVFHKLTGALTSKGLQILSADIHTLADQYILDRFRVHDPDHAAAPRSERLDEVRAALEAALTDRSEKAPSFRRIWGGGTEPFAASLETLPTRIQIDNNTSDRFTILDIFAHDRLGLLYAIARTIFELGLSVHVAKIGTYLDQVVDVFYLTDSSNQKIADDGQLLEIKNRLLASVQEHSAAN